MMAKTQLVEHLYTENILSLLCGQIVCVTEEMHKARLIFGGALSQCRSLHVS